MVVIDIHVLRGVCSWGWSCGYLGCAWFGHREFLPQQKYCMKISLTESGLKLFCLISMDVSCSKGCSKSVCAFRRRISHTARTIHWIPFQFTLMRCDIQYSSSKLLYEYNQHVSAYLNMTVFTQHCMPHENLLNHYFSHSKGSSYYWRNT